MKILKLALWLIMLYVVQTVFAGLISVYNTVPELLLAFSVVYCFRENDFKTASYIMIICGVLAGSMIGSSFPVAVLLIGLFSLAAFYAKNIFRFIPCIIRSAFMVSVCTFLLGMAYCFIASGSITGSSVYGEIIPYTAYTAVTAILLYPLVGKAFFREKDEKKLLIV